MTAEQLIAAKMAERAAKGFHFVVNFDNRGPFNYYAATKEEFGRVFAKYASRIGKTDETGSTVISVAA